MNFNMSNPRRLSIGGRREFLFSIPGEQPPIDGFTEQPVLWEDGEAALWEDGEAAVWEATED
jgi:hypothetical protein